MADGVDIVAAVAALAVAGITAKVVAVAPAEDYRYHCMCLSHGSQAGRQSGSQLPPAFLLHMRALQHLPYEHFLAIASCRLCRTVAVALGTAVATASFLMNVVLFFADLSPLIANKLNRQTVATKDAYKLRLSDCQVGLLIYHP